MDLELWESQSMRSLELSFRATNDQIREDENQKNLESDLNKNNNILKSWKCFRRGSNKIKT